jgi:hypothetical protein
LVNAVKAEEARKRCAKAAPASEGALATDIATKSRPISAPAIPPEATRKSW